MKGFLEYFHGIDKAALNRRHDHIYRVEVFLTIKKSRQIGFLLCRGMEAVALRASEAKQRSIPA
jgi:hypothetical protein